MYKDLKAWVVLLFLVLAGCQNPYTGLGVALDLEAPKVTITSHRNMDYVGSVFTLAGTASDNIGISEIKAEIRGTDLVFTTRPDSAGVWSLRISGSSDPEVPVRLTDGEYMVVVSASDAAGNTSTTSSMSITVVVDAASPSALVSEPDLKPLNYLSTLWLDGERDFQTVDLFKNGTFQIRGASEENFRLESLKVEILHGQEVVLEKILLNGQPLPAGIYGSIWNWTWIVPAEDIKVGGEPLEAGAIHFFKVRVTIKDMNPDNPATVLEALDAGDPGYFIIYPDADLPWSAVASHSDGESVQPGAVLSGNSWDDDGLGGIYLKVQKADLPPPDNDSYLGWADGSTSQSGTRVFRNFEGTPRMYTWNIAAPSDPGNYTLYVRTADGSSLADRGYKELDFTVVDVTFPMTEITSPAENLAVIPPSGKGDFTLEGFSYDNNNVSALKMAWIPKGQSAGPVLSGQLWENADSGQVFSDTSTGIRIWDLTPVLVNQGFDPDLPFENGGGRFKWTWSRTFNVESDFQKNGAPEYASRNLVFYTVDSNGNITYSRITLSGETESPRLEVTSPAKNGETHASTGENPFIFRGKVSDNSGVASVTLRWVEGDITAAADIAADGTWELNTSVFMSGTEAFQGDSNFEIKALDIYGNPGFSQTFLIVDNEPPAVSGVSSLAANGYYTVGTEEAPQTLVIQVAYTKDVEVHEGDQGKPYLLMNVGGSERRAVYTGGSGTNTLEFTYTVSAGDTSSDLDYTGQEALVLNGCTITDAKSSVPAGIRLPAPGDSGSLGKNKDLVIDTTAPSVSSLGFDALPLTDETNYFRAGAQIGIKVNFSEVVMVTGGSPVLQLNSKIPGPRNAVYSSGSGTNTLVFYYNVSGEDNADPLDAFSSSALTGTITDQAGNTALLTLPAAGEEGSLSAGARVVVDTAAPQKPSLLAGSTSTALTGGMKNADILFSLGNLETGITYEYALDGGVEWTAYTAGSTVTLNTDRQYLITARQKDKAGNISAAADTVNITLDKSAPAAPLIAGVFAGTFAETQEFSLSGESQAGTALQYTLNYNAATDENAPWSRTGSSWQDYTDKVQVSAAGDYKIRARQRDAAGNIGAPGPQINLTIDKDPPVVTGISTTTGSGSYNAGKQISITVTFNKKVYAIDGPKIWMMDVDADGTADADDRYADYAVGAGTDSLTFIYSVQAGDNSSKLDYVSAQALAEGLKINSASIKDAVGLPGNLTLPPPLTPGDGKASLSDLAAIIIDTSAPAVPSFTAQPAANFFTKDSVTLTIAGETGAALFYSLNGGATWLSPTPATGTGSFTVSATGTYNVKVKQRDAAGNESPEGTSHTFTIDSTPPEAPVIVGLVEGAGSTFAADQKFRPFGETGASFEFNRTYEAGDEDLAWGSGGRWESYSAADKDVNGNIVLTTAANSTTAYKVAARQRDAAGNVSSLSIIYNVTINKEPAVVTGVLGPETPKAAYKKDDIVNIRVVFDKAVYVVSGAPALVLETGATDRSATYSFGSGTNTLTFAYKVEDGDTAPDLDYVSSGYASPGNFKIWQDSIKDAVGNSSDLTLAAPGTTGSLGANAALIIDTAAPSAPTITWTGGGVSSGNSFNTTKTFTLSGESSASFRYSTDGGASWTAGTGASLSADGIYIIKAKQTDTAGNESAEASFTITIDKTPPAAPVILGLVNGTFSADQNFNVQGETGASLEYTTAYVTGDLAKAWGVSPWGSTTAGSNLSLTAVLESSYVVAARQRDAAGNVSPLSLVFEVTVNKIAPTVLSVTSSTPDGFYNLNKVINVEVTFSKAVYVKGAPSLHLKTGASATRQAAYATGSGTDTLKFSYIVQSGDTSSDLDYNSTTSLGLNAAGAIDDVVGNAAILTLPATGSPNSLAGSKEIVIDTDAPAAPVISGITAGAKKENQTFSLTGEGTAGLQYSINGGTNWEDYSAAVTITTEGAYNVTARQTDAAGNVSSPAATIALTLDKTEPAAPFISGITGGDKGTTQSFQVFGEAGATLEYSTNDGGSWTTYTGAVSLNPGAGNETTYNVLARQTDAAGNGPVATSAAITLKVDLLAPTIITYSPLHNAMNVSASSNIVLTFTEPVWRESGNIVIKRRYNGFPIVMTIEERNEYRSKLSGSDLTTFDSRYELTTNGSNSDGTPLTAGVYVLKYEYEANDTTLRTLFNSSSLKYNDIIIPVDSTQVKGSGTNTITLELAKSMPIGIHWYVLVDSTAFRDSVGNSFAGISSDTVYRFTTGPVAPPIIRINKQSGNGAFQPTTTAIRISTYTTGANIEYGVGNTSGAAPGSLNITIAGSAEATTKGTFDVGDGVIAGNRIRIQARAVLSGLSDSTHTYEQAFKTILIGGLANQSGNQTWFRGSNNSGGPTSAPGFPLAWEQNLYDKVRLSNSSRQWVTWEINVRTFWKAISGYLGEYPNGPNGFRWQIGVNNEVDPGYSSTSSSNTDTNGWDVNSWVTIR